MCFEKRASLTSRSSLPAIPTGVDRDSAVHILYVDLRAAVVHGRMQFLPALRARNMPDVALDAAAAVGRLQPRMSAGRQRQPYRTVDAAQRNRPLRRNPVEVGNELAVDRGKLRIAFQTVGMD